MNPPRLVLKHPLPSLPGQYVFTEGQNCHIEREGSVFWLTVDRVTRFVAEWRVDEYIREEPEEPANKCELCSEKFESPHALKIHRGMKHREART